MDDYIIHLSSQFERELEEIYRYIYYHLYSPQAADNFNTKVKLFISHLDLFPERYSKISVSKKSRYYNLRKMPVGNYIIIYEVNTHSHEIFIMHIFNGKQDYLNKL